MRLGRHEMTQPNFVRHDGASILVVDFSGADGSTIRERVAEAGRFISEQPPKSLLILARLTGIEFSPATTKVLLDHIAENKPFSQATAVVGLGHLARAVPIANRLTGRNLVAFDDESEALDWLALQSRPSPVPEDKIRFIEHSGQKILWIDFRSCSAMELPRRVTRAASIIRSEPLRSVLTLTLLHGMSYDEETTSLMKDYVRGNRPYVIAGAVLGLDYLRRIILPLNRLTGRKLRAFDDAESAKDWLVAEKRRMLSR
jgi:hypothetical protein